MSELPTKRTDGKCAVCEARLAKTTDGLFCMQCLRARIAKETPIEYDRFRTEDEREDKWNDQSPWQENAVRAIEDMLG